MGNTKTTIWEIIEFVSSSDAMILHLTSDANQTANPYLKEILENMLVEYNSNAGIDTGRPFLPTKVPVHDLYFIESKYSFDTKDPMELALGELLRYMGAGPKTRPLHGYYLFVFGKVIGFTKEKSIMDGDAREFIKNLFGIIRNGNNRELNQKHSAKPLAAYFINQITDFYITEKDDTVHKLRRDLAGRNKLMLGSALAFFGLPPDASLEDLSAARKKLLATSHPDTAPNDPDAVRKNEELSRRINETYEYILARMDR